MNRFLAAALLLFLPGAAVAQWKIVDDSPAQSLETPLIHEIEHFPKLVIFVEDVKPTVFVTI